MGVQKLREKKQGPILINKQRSKTAGHQLIRDRDMAEGFRRPEMTMTVIVIVIVMKS